MNYSNLNIYPPKKISPNTSEANSSSLMKSIPFSRGTYRYVWNSGISADAVQIMAILKNTEAIKQALGRKWGRERGSSREGGDGGGGGGGGGGEMKKRRGNEGIFIGAPSSCCSWWRRTGGGGRCKKWRAVKCDGGNVCFLIHHSCFLNVRAGERSFCPPSAGNALTTFIKQTGWCVNPW